MVHRETTYHLLITEVANSDTGHLFYSPRLMAQLTISSD